LCSCVFAKKPWGVRSRKRNDVLFGFLLKHATSDELIYRRGDRLFNGHAVSVCECSMRVLEVLAVLFDQVCLQGSRPAGISRHWGAFSWLRFKGQSPACTRKFFLRDSISPAAVSLDLSLDSPTISRKMSRNEAPLAQIWSLTALILT